MDSNQPPTPDTTPQPAAPPSNPTPQAPVPPTPTPTPMPPQPPQNSGSNTKKIIIIVAIVVGLLLLIFGGLVVFTAMRSIQDRAKEISELNEENEQEEEAGGFEQSVSASYLNDFDEVCKKVATIDNATAYTQGSTPKIAVLKQSPVSDTFTTMSPVFKDKSIMAADYNAVTETQLVACLTVDSTKDISGVCEAEQDGKKVTLKKTAVTYKLEVYEAKSGKKVGTGSVDGPITSCPFLVYYDASDPRVYGEPDSVKLESSIISIVN